jgi:Bacterial Ig-like domain (group 2)
MRSVVPLLLLTVAILPACEDDAGPAGVADSAPADAAADTSPPRDLVDTTATDAADGNDAADAGAIPEVPPDGPFVAAVVITPSNSSLIPGRSQQMRATAVHFDNTTTDVSSQATWTSSRPDVATVNSAGLVSTLLTGQTEISAQYQGVTGSTGFTVTTVATSGVVVVPAAASVARGTTRQFTAHLMFVDGNSLEGTENAQWSVEHSAIATVSNQDGQRGLVQALAEGQTTVRAMLGGLTGTATLTVTAP